MLVMIFIFPVFLLFLPTNRGCARVDVRFFTRSVESFRNISIVEGRECKKTCFKRGLGG